MRNLDRAFIHPSIQSMADGRLKADGQNIGMGTTCKRVPKNKNKKPP